jgi:hypothetical protein
VDAVAAEIVAAGGSAEATQVDALDEQAVERYAAAVATRAGASTWPSIGLQAVQGTPLIDMALEDFTSPISTWTAAQFHAEADWETEHKLVL